MVSLENPVFHTFKKIQILCSLFILEFANLPVKTTLCFSVNYELLYLMLSFEFLV